MSSECGAHTRRRASLVTPGTAASKITKALASAADEVIIDLEDSVIPDLKDSARRLLGDLPPRDVGTLAVRVNAPDSPWFADDLRAVAALGPVISDVVIPKVERGAQLETADRILDTAGAEHLSVTALIETAQGLWDVGALAAHGGRVSALVIGYADLGADLGRSPTCPPESWLATQDRVLCAARAAGIQAIDGPALHITADERLEADARRAADLGFDGKWVLHPAQIDTVTRAFTPTSDAVAHARAVLKTLAEAAESGHGAAQLGGAMLDEAVAVAARRTLTKAGERS